MLNTCGVLVGYHSDDIYVNIRRYHRYHMLKMTILFLSIACKNPLTCITWPLEYREYFIQILRQL